MLSYLPGIITHAIMITGFVAMMMVLIEYLNILSQGVWQRSLRGGHWRLYCRHRPARTGCLELVKSNAGYSFRNSSLYCRHSP